MIFTGKQIRLSFKDGDFKIYRGSAFNLEIASYDAYSWITVYLNGKEYANFPSDSILSVVEDSFSGESLR